MVVDGGGRGGGGWRGGGAFLNRNHNQSDIAQHKEEL